MSQPRIIERSFHPSIHEAENAIVVAAAFGAGGVLFYEAFLTGSEAEILRLLRDDSSRTWFWVHPPCGRCGKPLFGGHVNCPPDGETSVLREAYALWEDRHFGRRQS